MSYMTTPVRMMFDLQRTTIEQTHDAVTRGVETQRELGEQFADVGRVTEANERGFEVLRDLTDSYFHAVESAMPGQEEQIRDVRAVVEEQLDSLEAMQSEAVETLDANLQDRSEVADDVREEFLALFDDQVEALLGAHDDLGAETLETVEDVEASFDAEFERFEDRLADLQNHVEELTEETAERLSEPVSIELENAEAVEDQLQRINGIGPAYADRLRETGIDSLDALAAADVTTVAESAEVTETKAKGWIEQAQVSA